MKSEKRIYALIKRGIGFLMALCLLLLLWPLMLIVAVWIKIDSKGPAVFTQQRVGKNEKIFKIYKFRSMKTQTHDENGRALSDYERMTPSGKLIRKLSLDELPQLFNILKGDMAFIGPRPLLVEYIPRYNDFQRRRHEVLPGISGYAQVNGRNAISWEQKFEYDVYYVDHQSFLLDLKILFMTIGRVFAKKGIDQREGQTMDYFMGTEEKMD